MPKRRKNVGRLRNIGLRLKAFARGGSQRIRWVIIGAVALLALELLVFTPWGCTPNNDDTTTIAIDDRLVRVRLLASQSQVSISAAAPPVFFTQSNITPRALNLSGASANLSYSNSGWQLGAASLGQGELVLRPQSVGSLSVNGKAYRGQLRYIPLDAGRFDVINDVDIDDYLKGVIAEEMLKDWHIEAYKAQAVAARTYALYEKNLPRPQPRNFDVYADIRSQVYGGLSAETAKSIRAVDDTARIVLTCEQDGKDRIFKAYFSACCGGVGQSAADAFNESGVSALGDKYAGGQCAASPRYNLPPVVVRKDEMTRRVRAWAAARGRREQNIDLVRAVEISARNRFGRPVRYAIIDSRSARYEVIAEHMRNILNTTASGTALSSYFENVITESDQIRFVGGHGNGHGVGLCQWCAQMQALSGMPHEQILLRAYPGAKLLTGY